MASFESLPTEVAQKCVEFLAFDEAIQVKSVSRGLRKAARRALTRGHWRPIRFISEHGLATLRNCSQGGLNSLDDGVAATFRAAWAREPALVMRIIQEDIVPAPWPMDHNHNDAFQAVFLNIVEPSIEGGGIERIIAACEGVYRKVGGKRDDFGRLLFSAHRLLMSWAGKLGKISDHLRARLDWVDLDLPNRESRRIAAALESWTDMKLAVILLEESRAYGASTGTTFIAKAYMWSQRWKDKEKANAFWTETNRKHGASWG